MEQIIIIRRDGSRVPLQNRGTTTRISSAKQKVELLGADTVDITVQSPFPQAYEIGDRIEIFGRRYTLNVLPKVKKESAYNFQYDLQFEGVQYDLARASYDVTIDTTGVDVQGDSLTGDLRRFMQVLIANISRIFPGKWVLGSCPDTDTKTLTFGDSDNCLSVLQNVCDEYGLEFEIIQSANGVCTINITNVGKTFPFTFKYGKGLGIYELTREKVSSSNIVTRLKCYGSTKNITSKYRCTKLCLPNKTKAQSFLEDAKAIAQYGIWENTKNFDDIYPHRTGTISALGDSVLKFSDSTMFNLNETESDGKTTKYLLNGVSAKVHFNTGNLAGYEFEIHAYDHATHTFTLKKITDNRDMSFPSETSSAFQFGIGDEYVLIDIALPQSYIDEAEKKLLEAGTKFLQQNCQPKVQYSLTLDEFFLKSIAGLGTTSNAIWVGDYIPVIDTDIDVDKSIRVKSFTRDLIDEYKYTLTIADVSVERSTYTRVISDLIDIDKILTINNLKDPAKARRNWLSAQEVLNMVFDPEGDYYTDKIKPNSVDTLMLSVGAKSMQFGLVGTVFQPNFNGNKNLMRVKGGILTHYAIEEMPRSWTLSDGDTTFLSDSQAYYIYAKVLKQGNTGTIVFTPQQIGVEEDAMNYHFWIGVVNSVDTMLHVRSVSLTYGFTTVNGRFIKTGRIQSPDGSTYFDLDAGEIGGKIVFDSNGQEKTLEELGQESLDAKNYIDNTLPGILNDLRAQLDGQIEQFFYEYDPTTSNIPAKEWTTTTLKENHLGDLFYNTKTGKVFRWVKEGTVYKWKELQNSEVANALALANDALALAREKRRIFTSTPIPPYDIGDLWVNGADLRRCQTAKVVGQSYSINDWVIAVNYDNTKTVIDGGIVTSGTVQLAGSGGSILAGITGEGTEASSVRFWAGASKENRNTAPFRVLQDGSIIASKATIEGIIKAISGSIGGFEIGQGRIGVSESSEMEGKYNGLALLSDFIKFSKTNLWAGIGANVFPASSGLMGLGRFEYSGSSYNSGIGLYTKFRPRNNSSWYTQRALQVDGNSFSIGGNAHFDDTYHGEAYTDIIEEYIGITNNFFFGSIGAAYRNVRLPGRAYMNRTVSELSGKDISFLLYIQIGWLGNSNRIKLSGCDDGVLVDNNAERINGGNGWLDMAQGDSLVLRYCNGHYYTVRYGT